VFAFEIEKIPLKFNLFLDFNTRPERISPAADELLLRIGLSRQPEAVPRWETAFWSNSAGG